MKKIISFLNTDIKIINSYFLFTIVLIILVCIGYSSYALFSFTKTSSNVIEGKVGKINYTTNFSYTGSCPTYTAKSTGYYNLEVWGAQGGNYNTTYVGGLGGYSKGIVHLEKGTTLYVCVGGQPQTVTTTKTAVPGGFNGGGNGFNRDYSSTYTYGQAGGGATDIRIGQNSLYARVIVAGGGSATTSGSNYKYGASGGGGGFYGGGAGTSYSDSTNYDKYSGGGSGYVYTSSTASSYPSGCLLNSTYYLTVASTTEAINTGHGKATITYIGKNKPIGVDTLIALTDNKDNSGLYTITHAKDSTLQIGNDKDITEYRYRGANPKNYVNFNNETWRILGIFPTDDGNGNIENRIKLIRNESIGSYPWDSNGYNNWTKATLNTFLNETYYNGLSANEKELIGNSKYYLGGYNNAITPTPVSMYSNERKISGSAHYYNNNPTNWIGKISLMYASDYGYATENCELKLLYNASSSSNDIRTCNNTNWLYNLKIEEKLLPQYTNASESSVFFLMSNGQIHGIGSSTYGMAIRPVLYLNNNVKIKNGDGTESNPYVFDLEL